MQMYELIFQNLMLKFEEYNMCLITSFIISLSLDKHQGCYKSDVCVCVWVCMSLCGIAAPKIMELERIQFRCDVLSESLRKQDRFYDLFIHLLDIPISNVWDF